MEFPVTAPVEGADNSCTVSRFGQEFDRQDEPLPETAGVFCFLGHGITRRSVMQTKIRTIRAMEILDSRGSPTVRVIVELDNGLAASASVPSWASIGENEEVELRDGDKKR